MTTLNDVLAAVVADMREVCQHSGLQKPKDLPWSYAIQEWADRIEALAQPGAVGGEVCCGNYNYNGDCCYRKVPATQPPAAVGEAVAGVVTGWLPKQRVIEVKLDAEVPGWVAVHNAPVILRPLTQPPAKSQGWMMLPLIVRWRCWLRCLTRYVQGHWYTPPSPPPSRTRNQNDDHETAGV